MQTYHRRQRHHGIRRRHQRRRGIRRQSRRGSHHLRANDEGEKRELEDKKNKQKKGKKG